MPYRIDLDDPPEHALDTLVALGALDVEAAGSGIAALLPDAVTSDAVAIALGGIPLRVSAVTGRDDDSIWSLSRRPIRIGSFVIVPADLPPSPGSIRLVDSDAFGTGLHPTTALCLEAIDDHLRADVPARMLDIGTGSGVLALAALRRGVPHARGVDTDPTAIRVAAANAVLNELAARLTLVEGGPEAVAGTWPLVVANIRAADLMEMAQALARRVASRGRLVLSGIPVSVAFEVERVYQRLGMKTVSTAVRDGWVALVFYPSW